MPLNSLDKRHLRTRDHEIDLVVLRKLDKLGKVADADVYVGNVLEAARGSSVALKMRRQIRWFGMRGRRDG